MRLVKFFGKDNRQKLAININTKRKKDVKIATRLKIEEVNLRVPKQNKSQPQTPQNPIRRISSSRLSPGLLTVN